MNSTVLGYKTILLKRMRRKSELRHHGIKGMKWGIRNGPPYPIHRDSSGKPVKKNIAKDKKDDIIKETIRGREQLEKRYKPNAIVDSQRDDGSIKARVYYDEKGYKKLEIHTHDHGHPKQHPFGTHGEHAHDYEWTDDGKLKNRTRRNIDAKEREDNKDIL